MSNLSRYKTTRSDNLYIPMSGVTMVLIETNSYAGNTYQDICLAVFGKEYSEEIRSWSLPEGYEEEMIKRGYTAQSFFDKSKNCMSEYGQVIANIIPTPGLERNGYPVFNTIGLFFKEELSDHDLSQIREIVEKVLTEEHIELIDFGQMTFKASA
mgnify:CR=1 FL=1